MGRFDITSLGLGIVLATAATAANAQTVISREVTTEPVETIVTQGPDGSTLVSRRPLGAQRTLGAQTGVVYDTPSSRVVETIETVERPAAPTVRRQVIRQGANTTTRIERKQVQPRSQTSVRTTRRTTTTQAAAPLSLTPDDRRIVYQTVVRERAIPQAAPQVMTRDVVTQPAPRLAYRSPMTTVVEPASPVVEAVDSYVGTSLPQDVEYYDVPASLAVRLPATRSYRYAYLDDRVLLVDPVSHVVVADITDQ